MRYEQRHDYENILSAATQKNLHYDMHFHQCVEFNRVVSGDGIIITLPGKREIFTQGELAFIPCLVPHSVETIGDTVEENLIIPLPFINNLYKSHGSSLQIFKMDKPGVNQKLFLIIDEIKSLIGSPHVELLDAYINVLFLTMLKEYATQQNQFTVSNFDLVIEIIDYINKHFKENITVYDVAHYFGYNKNYFSKLFGSLFLCNFRTYVNRLRIMYIERENANPQNTKSVTELIHDAGFKDISTYYRTKNKIIPPPARHKRFIEVLTEMRQRYCNSKTANGSIVRGFILFVFNLPYMRISSL